MWGFRRSRRSDPSPVRARLQLEPLDPRLVPSSLDSSPEGTPQTESSLLDQQTVPSTLDSGPDRLPLLNRAPVIENFLAVHVVGTLWQFSGDVNDESPGGLTIKFGGSPVTLQGQTTTTDANGHFEVAFYMNTDGTDTGVASAQTTDSAGLVSEEALSSVDP